MTPKLEQLVNLAGQHARMVMVELHQPLMTTFMYLTEEGAVILGTPWEDNVEKKMMAMEVRRAMLQDNAYAYSMVTEAWTATAPKGWNPDTDTPIEARKQPDRREIVLAFATDGEAIEWKRWGIKRDHLEMVTDLEEEDFSPEKATSWLTQLLKK